MELNEEAETRALLGGFGSPHDGADEDEKIDMDIPLIQEEEFKYRPDSEEIGLTALPAMPVVESRVDDVAHLSPGTAEVDGDAEKLLGLLRKWSIEEREKKVLKERKERNKLRKKRAREDFWLRRKVDTFLVVVERLTRVLRRDKGVREITKWG